MELQVVGAGFGRTGTASMKAALEQLGVGPAHHMMEVFGRGDAAGWAAAIRGEGFDPDALLDGYRSTLDFPSCLLWRELAARHPSAKVLLTVRSSESWWRSFSATIGPEIHRAEPHDDPGFQALVEAIDIEVFGGRADDRDTAVAAYEAHNDAVRAEVPADRLLVYEVGSGWEPLCGFLGLEVPAEAFPHTNTTEQFLTRGE